MSATQNEIINSLSNSNISTAGTTTNTGTATNTGTNSGVTPPAGASMTPTTSNTQTQTSAGSATTPTQGQQNNEDAIKNLKQEAINKMTLAMTNIWDKSYNFIIEAINTQYKYIVEYSKITNPTNKI